MIRNFTTRMSQMFKRTSYVACYLFSLFGQQQPAATSQPAPAFGQSSGLFGQQQPAATSQPAPAFGQSSGFGQSSQTSRFVANIVVFVLLSSSLIRAFKLHKSFSIIFRLIF